MEFCLNEMCGQMDQMSLDVLSVTIRNLFHGFKLTSDLVLNYHLCYFKHRGIITSSLMKRIRKIEKNFTLLKMTTGSRTKEKNKEEDLAKSPYEIIQEKIDRLLKVETDGGNFNKFLKEKKNGIPMDLKDPELIMELQKIIHSDLRKSMDDSLREVDKFLRSLSIAREESSEPSTELQEVFKTMSFAGKRKPIVPSIIPEDLLNPTEDKRKKWENDLFEKVKEGNYKVAKVAMSLVGKMAQKKGCDVSAQTDKEEAHYKLQAEDPLQEGDFKKELAEQTKLAKSLRQKLDTQILENERLETQFMRMKTDFSELDSKHRVLLKSKKSTVKELAETKAEKDAALAKISKMAESRENFKNQEEKNKEKIIEERTRAQMLLLSKTKDLSWKVRLLKEVLEAIKNKPEAAIEEIENNKNQIRESIYRLNRELDRENEKIGENVFESVEQLNEDEAKEETEKNEQSEASGLEKLRKKPKQRTITKKTSYVSPQAKSSLSKIPKGKTVGRIPSIAKIGKKEKAEEMPEQNDSGSLDEIEEMMEKNQKEETEDEEQRTNFKRKQGAASPKEKNGLNQGQREFQRETSPKKSTTKVIKKQKEKKTKEKEELKEEEDLSEGESENKGEMKTIEEVEMEESPLVKKENSFEAKEIQLPKLENKEPRAMVDSETQKTNGKATSVVSGAAANRVIIQKESNQEASFPLEVQKAESELAHEGTISPALSLTEELQELMRLLKEPKNEKYIPVFSKMIENEVLEAGFGEDGSTLELTSSILIISKKLIDSILNKESFLTNFAMATEATDKKPEESQLIGSNVKTDQVGSKKNINSAILSTNEIVSDDGRASTTGRHVAKGENTTRILANFQDLTISRDKTSNLRSNTEANENETNGDWAEIKKEFLEMAPSRIISRSGSRHTLKRSPSNLSLEQKTPEQERNSSKHFSDVNSSQESPSRLDRILKRAMDQKSLLVFSSNAVQIIKKRRNNIQNGIGRLMKAIRGSEKEKEEGEMEMAIIFDKIVKKDKEAHTEFGRGPIRYQFKKIEEEEWYTERVGGGLIVPGLDFEAIRDGKMTFDEFKKVVGQYVSEHEKCGVGCLHLFRFFKRIDYDSASGEGITIRMSKKRLESIDSGDLIKPKHN